MQHPHLRRISALCAARSLAYLDDMSVPQGFLAFTLAALLRLELHPHLGILQRSQPVLPAETAYRKMVRKGYLKPASPPHFHHDSPRPTR
ncbi:hypothetical protein HMPREF9371_0393 [Neisseria shayeganii 871]|uniref:Uncharacterized protein n=1 Tax=Neisseria shayeganii 871 TaxID=1032488 RepID=G4CFK4_9NEIS|nr:hypothetical protein HMPREF9371_0393 [Neisseria shayeganii 871]